MHLDAEDEVDHRLAGEAYCRVLHHPGAEHRDAAGRRVRAGGPADAESDARQVAPRRTDCCPPAEIAERREHRASVRQARDADPERVQSGLPERVQLTPRALRAPAELRAPPELRAPAELQAPPGLQEQVPGAPERALRAWEGPEPATVRREQSERHPTQLVWAAPGSQPPWRAWLRRTLRAVGAQQAPLPWRTLI